MQNLNIAMEQYLSINLMEGQLVVQQPGRAEVLVYDPRTESEVLGKVEAVRIFDGVCKLVIDEQMHDLHQVLEIRGVKK